MFSRRAGRSLPWEAAEDPALAYSLHQLAWFRRAMNRSRRASQFTEMLILLSTASTLVVSALREPAQLTAGLAASAVFLTGYRQVFNPTDQWVGSSLTWLELQHEIVRYQLLDPEERDREARRALLDRTIEIISVENRAWADRRRANRPLAPTVVETGASQR